MPARTNTTIRAWVMSQKRGTGRRLDLTPGRLRDFAVTVVTGSPSPAAF